MGGRPPARPPSRARAQTPTRAGAPALPPTGGASRDRTTCRAAARPPPPPARPATPPGDRAGAGWKSRGRGPADWTRAAPSRRRASRTRPRPARTEVGELDGFGTAEKHVCGLHIPVDDALLMDRVERSRHAAEHAQRLVGRERPARGDNVGEGLALHVLHHDHDVAVLLELGVVHEHQIRMIQRCPHQRLALQAQNPLGIARGVHPLQRHLPAEHGVLGKRHFRHASRP